MTEAECREKVVPTGTPCPEHCVEHYDCGVTCSCPGGDTGLFLCWAVTPCSDLPPLLQDATCNQCEDEETMEYTTCGSCDKTCDNTSPICPLGCVKKCQC